MKTLFGRTGAGSCTGEAAGATCDLVFSVSGSATLTDKVNRDAGRYPGSVSIFMVARGVPTACTQWTLFILSYFYF